MNVMNGFVFSTAIVDFYITMSHELSIGYYDPFDLYPLVKPSLDTKLPLTNLHWRPRSNSTFKSISKLPVKFVEEVPRIVPTTESNQNVYARIMFIKQTNIETYKSQVRPLIKEWLRNLVHKDNTEWMIVLYIPIQTREKVSNLIKSSIVDKVRADFGKDGKQLPLLNIEAGDVERCFKLKEFNDKEVNKLEIYNDLVNCIKNLILLTFESKHSHIDQKLNSAEIIDRPYLRLLLAKAALFSDLNLFKDSLQVYQDASEAVKAFCTSNPDALDLSFPVLDLTKFNVDTVLKSIDMDQLLKNGTMNLFSLNFILFDRKTEMFYEFIKNENLVSINAIHISNLLQTLLLFLNDLTHKFGDVAIELNYALIDYYLLLSSITNVFNLSLKEVNLSNILEFRGDLRLFQRSQLVKLGRQKGYTSKALTGILQEVSLNEDSHKTRDVTYEPLKEVLTNEITYVERFEKLTELVIQDFVACGRSKSIDILSIDLAIIKFEKKDYKEALNILQDSHEFFIESGWSYMGGTLLEVYLDCIKHMGIENPPLQLNTYLKLFSNLNLGSNHTDGNNFRQTKTSKQIQDLFEDIVTLSSKITKPIEYPVDEFFNICLEPYIYKDESSDLDIYCMDLRIENVFGTHFSFESVELIVSDGLKFSAHQVKVDTSRVLVVRLYSNVFKHGIVYQEKLIITISPNLSLVHSFISADPSSEDTVIHNNSILDESVVQSTLEPPRIQSRETPQLLFYESCSGFACDVQLPSVMTLGQTQLLLRMKNGRSAIDNIRTEIFSADLNFKLRERKWDLKDVSLAAEEEFEVNIPYTYSGENKLINIDLKVVYEISGQHFEYSKRVALDTSLTLSVTVHDIFKSSFVFSKFQISAANSSYAIIILNSSLENYNSNYQVEAPQNLPKNQIVLSEQPYSSFYKICPHKSYRVSLGDTFLLVIGYSNVIEECMAYVETRLKSLFDDAKLMSYWCLFRTVILQHIKIDTKATFVQRKIIIENIDEVTGFVQEALIYISAEQRKSAFLDTVTKCLLDIQKTVELAPVPKILKISVPVPNIDILQVINFAYTRKSHYMVGEPIPMTAEIESITRWSSKSESLKEEVSIIAESSPTRSKATQRAHQDDFQLILVDDDNWLISGFKRKNFSIDFDSDSTYGLTEFTLIPLVVGHLSLPKVMIKVQNEKNYTMDITVKNGTECLLVVPELENIVFSF